MLIRLFCRGRGRGGRSRLVEGMRGCRYLGRVVRFGVTGKRGVRTGEEHAVLFVGCVEEVVGCREDSFVSDCGLECCSDGTRSGKSG